MNEKLLMQIGLIDQITKPLQGITKEIQGAMDVGKSGMQDMVTGGAGLVATGFAIQNALMPAIEMDRKIGEVKSLGVTDEALKQLSNTALKFSAEYGKSATEFVDASYDIKSAMGNLNGVELAGITESSAILAAATKADTKTITDYMGTMYGIFETQAEKMGKADWAAQVAGMTAKSVEMFKTDGNKMAQAFSQLGSSATAFGVDMSEQMAVLGSLGASMGGGAAATKYTAFLTGATTAQKKLGLSFFDSSGKMLPMVEILDKIQGRIGHMKDDKQFQVLKNAFGSVEAVKLIQNLQSKTGSLTKQINELGSVKGMRQAELMASAMTDQWERLEASWFAIRAAVFGMILPSFNAIAGSIADGLTWLTAMTDQYPMLTQVISYAAIGALSLGGVVASLSLVMGIAKMMSAGWAVTMLGLSSSLKLLGAATQMLTLKTWLLNAAFWANPITWIVAGIFAAVAAIWIFKDYIGAFLDGFISGFIEASGVATLFEPLILAFKLIGSAIGWVFDWVVRLLTPIDAASESLISFASAGQMVGFIIGSVFQGILMPIKVVMMALDQFLQLINKIPGIDINFDLGVSDLKDIPEVNGTLSNSIDVTNTDTSVIDYKNPQNAPALNPAMVQNLNSTQSRQTVNSRNYGDIYVTTTNGFSFEDVEERRDLDAG
ncbi:Phage tail tape measure protein, family [Vibrio aestuarianus]|uniref:phage tail tape measure protein n=2 Tax=Vibrio aestuarianus TaxID=28171 RepID=UPI0014562294|nr:phage tail tape measure protein [Vibrio aestuarianus]NLS65211.1 phage tail tape measure protein [Vibrio aestuarianus subsp. francensis]CAH8213422.1 Phage tail tape measure protein, family [Vibrio aestuarianus]